MTSHSGYLLIADISGYTAYLTASEQEHANPILRSLLTTLVDQVGDPLHLWRMDGDAVLAYSTAHDFPDGETFLGICENIYNAFTERKRDIIANTTCTCQACANVETLDLKIMAHHGDFEEMQIGPMKDISGADVILVHRMAKTDVKEVTGIRSYALFTDAAVEEMGISSALTPFSQDFDHFGDVSMQVYDLAKAWESFRAKQERYFLTEEDGIWTYRHRCPHAAHVVWQALIDPNLKQKWMGMRAVTVENQQGRVGMGSDYHCAHTEIDFFYKVTDWEPFNYFSTVINDSMHKGLKNRETYELTPTEDGTEIRYTMGPVKDDDGNRNEKAEKEIIEILSAFWPAVFDAMIELIETKVSADVVVES
jgi:uncharacterized protein YndB with AHSA1/START domain